VSAVNRLRKTIRRMVILVRRLCGGMKGHGGRRFLVLCDSSGLSFPAIT
jgi:hypothetical protein